MNDNYKKNLENVIKQMLNPLRNIPLHLVIGAISGHEVIPFRRDDERDAQVLNKLVKVAEIAGASVNRNLIKRPGPNEVGNDMEPYVKAALMEVGYRASAPLSRTGKKKTTGYPDIEFVDEFGRPNYLECKTYNRGNIATTQRYFYLSPSEDFKITKNAHHFAVSYEIFVEGFMPKT